MNYFQWMEKTNIKNLHNFNDKVKWFERIEPTKEFSHTDATCYTKDGRKITVELKTRKETLQQFKNYGDILIEPKKISHFTDVMESGFTLNENCLYINFTADGVAIFNFNEMKQDSLVVYPNHRQYNPGKKHYEFETRFGWKTRDAILYTKEENNTYTKIQRN